MRKKQLIYIDTGGDTLVLPLRDKVFLYIGPYVRLGTFRNTYIAKYKIKESPEKLNTLRCVKKK